MDSFPSGICERIEVTAADRRISASEITKLKQAGSTGALIASVLAFTQGDPPDPEYMALTLPSAALARRPHQPGCIDRLLSICRTSQYEYLKTDPGMRAALTTAVMKALATQTEIGEAAVLLLDLRGYLLGGLLTGLTAKYRPFASGVALASQRSSGKTPHSSCASELVWMTLGLSAKFFPRARTALAD
jgi:hypothetical protein